MPEDGKHQWDRMAKSRIHDDLRKLQEKDRDRKARTRSNMLYWKGRHNKLLIYLQKDKPETNLKL